MTDLSWRGQCLALADGTLNVCFAAPTGINFRVEASTDLGNWETVYEARSVDGALHFVDLETSRFQQRFYRLAPQSVAVADE